MRSTGEADAWSRQSIAAFRPARPASAFRQLNSGGTQGAFGVWRELLNKAFVISMASTWEKIRDFYDWAVENGDKRTDPWFLVYSPIPVFVTFIIYLLICKYGPKYMLNREPFNLKYVLIVYNFALVAISAYIFWEFLVTSIRANYSYLCEPVDYSNSELGLRMAKVCWWFFFSKVIELMDTVFFILRKKHNQVTFLHIYHHGTMIFNWWAGVKYVPGGQSFFIGLLNSFVHIVMYLYYGIAAMGPHMRKYLWWKRYLTMLQLVVALKMALVILLKAK
ncbi:very long chain fatty acid elongase 4-like isoform X2 [Mobula hypostoma]|uniref:very long chain fatty acid elongase 4-like isoform X2 n=1 Tax=Mobula hypostoma TaxID=723540 RepID=UPI002FC32ED3